MGIERPRAQRRLAILVAVALALGLAALAVRPALERLVRRRLESAASRRGLTARIEAVRVGLWPPLRLNGVTIETSPGLRLGADRIDAWWIGRVRVAMEHAVLEAPGGLTVSAPSTTWEVAGLMGSDRRLVLRRPVSGLVLTHATGAGEGAWNVEASDLPVGRLLDVRRLGRPLVDGGTVSGTLALHSSKGVTGFEVALAARSARLPALGGDAPEEQSLGEPTNVAVRATGTWSGARESLEMPRWTATITGAALSGSLTLHDLGTDPEVDLALDAERMEFARLLRASGLEVPRSLCPAAGDACADDLGSASLAATARGRLVDAASFVVTQRLEFTPPRRMPAAIERLRGPFVDEVSEGAGGDANEGAGTGAGAVAAVAAVQGRSIDISPASPDFIPLQDVPPLFRRALLLAEDAGFYSHPGIDLREMPAALITDWERGGAARGGSTITQQLAKNLFLSYDKRLGRKLQELPITLLLERALGKDRILEIYLNVIEWGPDLYGLRPAARAYFGREPGDLSPAQMAFLVALIPGPLKYQVSFAHGTPGPGFRKLMDGVLAKLRSVDALNEEEYQRALGEEIVVQGRGGAQGTESPPPQ